MYFHVCLAVLRCGKHLWKLTNFRLMYAACKEGLLENDMKTTLKMFALAVFVTASASSAFAAIRYDRDYVRSAPFDGYHYGPWYGAGTDRESQVEHTGN
jgi:hypothetical protein